MVGISRFERAAIIQGGRPGSERTVLDVSEAADILLRDIHCQTEKRKAAVSLKDSRISKIKIDKDLVGGLASSVKDQALVKAVIDLGQTLGIEVVGEGVETDADRMILRSLGCIIAQGFLFSAALPPRDALAFDADHFGNFASAESFFDPVTLSLRNPLSGRAA
ncbi:hypothetical protein C7I87_33095 [Mesorhizobium sp. SARCC-RB16n]|uniref:EAL domain-containing protein n=1 Tax=Mesorhizobium sp. SARCC-RB16n TaxID=2116687 RepID=UPI00122ED189|nr:EAL domain-containing protein [Mesorhizobium sp. SARCC-RB16n]KAA3441923.1 hypothetical protein C7I87_33095 [Mesorhizobium sp. SARCC-RB16n]